MIYLKAVITIVAMPSTFSKVRALINNLFSKDPYVTLISNYDVSGFCDIIMEITFKGQIEEFHDKVLSKFLSLSDVNKTTTFPITKASPKENTSQLPVTGFIFINAIPQQIDDVQQELVKIDNIISADIIGGEYDIMAKTVIPINKLPEFVYQIQTLNGIIWSRTCIPLDVFRALDERMKNEIKE